MNKKQIKVLESAIKTFGIEKQLEMVIEECAELILALQKYKRNPTEEILINMVLQETADVDIIINQIKFKVMILGMSLIALFLLASLIAFIFEIIRKNEIKKEYYSCNCRSILSLKEFTEKYYNRI